MKQLKDNYGRKHDYLRISVTDRCNLRCIYCMGPDGIERLPHRDILSYEEILEVVKCGAKKGITKIRITGGEPLVRRNLAHLVKEIRNTPGIEDLAITTNGILLPQHAGKLKKAGLKRVNISLDTLIPEKYKSMTRGGELPQVLKGIDTAIRLGLEPVKINTVLMNGFNDSEVTDFLNLARTKNIHVRFIEYMPIGEHDGDYDGRYLPLNFVKDSAENAGYTLTPVKHPLGAGPAEYFSFTDGGGSIGLIHSISKHFCSSCNRLRLTADGRLKSCLYWQEEEYVRPFLKDPDKLASLMQEVISRKPKEHCMGHGKKTGTVNPATMRTMSRTGG